MSIAAALLGQAIRFAAPGEDNVRGGYGGLGLANKEHIAGYTQCARCV